MKAFVLEGINKLNYREVEQPVLSEGEVLVKVEAAGICGSDIPRIFETGTYNFPTIPGHEFSGTVAKIFNDNDKYLLGKRVSVFPLIPCKECIQCKNEKYEMCENYNYIGSRTDGAFAEYVKVPVWNLIELNESISFENAAMFEPTCVALHAIRKVEVNKSQTIAVYGTGTIGILIIQWLIAFGVKNIIAIGNKKDQKELLDTIGEIEFFNVNDFDNKKELVNSVSCLGIDCVFECVGRNDTISNSLSIVKPEGKIVYIGNPHGDITFEKDVYWRILRKQINISGVWNSSFTHSINDDWNTTAKFIEEGKINPSLQITHKYEFEKINQALNVMKEKKEFSNKVLLINS